MLRAFFSQHSSALTTTQTQLEEMKEGMNVLRSQNELFAAQVEEKNKMIQVWRRVVLGPTAMGVR